MNLRGAFVVFKKEVLNSIRDKRIIYSTLIVPLILPIFMLGPVALSMKKEAKLKIKPSYIAVIGAEDEALVDYLWNSGKFRFVEIADTPEEAIKNERVHCVLELRKEDDVTKAVILYDATRDGSRVAMEKLKSTIMEYVQNVAKERLKAEGIPVSILESVKVVEKNVVSPSEMGGFFTGMMLGIIIAITAITGGMVVAIDATAGEKERRTLEVLLASPLSRGELLLGKFIAVMAFSLFSVLLTALSVALTFSFGASLVAKESIGGFTLPISLSGVLSLGVVVLFYTGFMASIALAISTFARSFREAQNYFTPITLLIVVPVIFIQSLPASPGNVYFYLPIFNIILFTREVFMGHVIPAHFSNTLFSNVMFAFLGFRLAQRIFMSEKAILR